MEIKKLLLLITTASLLLLWACNSTKPIASPAPTTTAQADTFAKEAAVKKAEAAKAAAKERAKARAEDKMVRPSPVKTAKPNTSVPMETKGFDPDADLDKLMPAPQLPDGFNPKGPIPFDNTVRKGVLSNGMTYYIKSNGKPADFAELRLVLKAGSILENDDQQGLAHFVEHMAFNGTRNFPKHDLINFLESSGVKFGAHLNAYTSFDETVYMLRVPTDSTELFHKGMLIIEDWASGVLMEDEEIEAERGVVIEEWRLRRGANQRMQSKTFPAMFYDSHYAKRLPIGKKDTLEVFKPETLRNFYNDWYRPDLMAVVVVGDIDVDDVENLVKERFNRIPRLENPRERVQFDVPAHKETQIAIATDKEASYNVVQLAYKHPRKSAGNMLSFRNGVIGSVVNSMLDARLSELIQSEKPPFSYAYTGYGRMVGNTDTYSSFAIVPDGGHKAGLEALLVENERAMRHGFTQSEMDRATKSIITGLEKSVNEDGKTPSRRVIGAFVQHFLTNRPALNPTQRLNLYKALIPTLSLEEVNFMIRRWVTEENRVVVMTGIEKADSPVPTKQGVKNVLASITGREIAPYEDETADKPLMASFPKSSPANANMYHEKLGVHELIFPNGVKVIYKKTDFKNDEIRISAFSPGGHAMVDDDEFQSASMSDAIVSSSGLGPYTAQQLDKYMSDKVVRVSPYVGEIQDGFSGSSSVADFETALQMIHLYCTNPLKDEAAFNSMMTRQKSFVKNRFNSPSGHFYREMNKDIYNDHPRREAMSVEFLDKVKLDKAHEIFKKRFSNASDFTFMFVGNIDESTFPDLAARYLGSLPGNGKTEPQKDLGIRRSAGDRELIIRKGTEDQSTVRLMYHGDMEWNLRNMVEMNAMTQTLSIMLRESMREEQGKVYGVGVRPSRSHYPVETYAITVSFSCAPANVDLLISIVEEQIKALKENGPSETNLQKVQETMRKEIQVGLEDNGYWMGQLNLMYQNGLEPNEINNNLMRVNALNAAKIKAAANRYFNPNQRFKGVLLPVRK
ncbi:MAG: M16 family metallopeptidase [Bacteroidia bacterium]